MSVSSSSDSSTQSPSTSVGPSYDEEEDAYEGKPLQSLDDLPTDDSSLDSSSDNDDSSLEGDDKHPPSSNQKNPVAYDEASSSSSSDDDSSDSSSDDEEDTVEQQASSRQQPNSIGEGDESSNESSSEEEDNVQNLSLEERILMKQQAGRSDSRRADEQERKSRALQVASQRLQQHKQQEKSTASEGKKRSKHKPTEASSKRRDFFQRGAPTLDSSGVGVEITAHRYKPRDPRMSATGKSNNAAGALDNNYAFLQDLRNQEIVQLKKQIAVRKLPGKKGQKARRKMGLSQGSLQHDQEELKRLMQERAAYERAQLDLLAKQAVKRKMQQQVASGKGVYYLKKREMKKLQLEAKFEELRKRGGDKAVDRAVAKRRKKNKSKDTGYFIPKDR